MDNQIKKFVYRVRARLKEQQIITNLMKFAAIGMTVASVISCISMVVPLYYAVPIAIGTVVFCFVIGIIAGIRSTPSPMKAALKADARGHKERISTAFFLMGREDTFSSLQKRDALKVMDTFSIRKEFPLRLEGKRLFVVLVMALVFVISSIVDTPAREKARAVNDVKKEAKEDIARLEKVEKKLEENRELSEKETAEIKEQIEKAKQELAKADSREELKKAEERITKKMEMAGEKAENKTLSEIMQKAASEAKETTKNKEQDFAREAKKALEKAEKGNRKDKQEAYEKIKKLADTLGDEQLKRAAEEYKDSSYSDSNYAEAERTLGEAVKNLEKEKDLAQNKDNANSRANNSNQNNGINQNQNGSNSGNQNNSQNNGNSKNGQNSGNGNGSGDLGSGTGSGWNYGGKEGKEGVRKSNESITVPDGDIGDDENLTGKANGNATGTKQKSDQSQAWSGSKVSYGKVSGKYKEKAYKKVNGSRYPGKLKNKIRDYFDGLY